MPIDPPVYATTAGLTSAKTGRRKPPERGSRSFGRELDGLCLAICHDLRGPVTTAGAAVSGLARTLAVSDTERRHWLEIARQSLARADELLLSLPLLIARERSEPGRVLLEPLLEQVRADIAPELGLAEGRLIVKGPLGTVRADPDRLRIALRNLLRNAVQHRRPRIPLVVHVRSWSRGEHLVLTISDNGAGLPRRERARLAGPLRAGLGKPHGGLGLAIARGAIEACDGRLEAVGHAGAGTTFAVTLRRAEPAAAASTEPGSAAPAAERLRRRRRAALAPTPP